MGLFSLCEFIWSHCVRVELIVPCGLIWLHCVDGLTALCGGSDRSVWMGFIALCGWIGRCQDRSDCTLWVDLMGLIALCALYDSNVPVDLFAQCGFIWSHLVDVSSHSELVDLIAQCAWVWSHCVGESDGSDCVMHFTWSHCAGGWNRTVWMSLVTVCGWRWSHSVDGSSRVMRVKMIASCKSNGAHYVD